MDFLSVDSLLNDNKKYIEMLEKTNNILLDPSSAQMFFQNYPPDKIFQKLFTAIDCKLFDDTCIQLSMRIVANVLQSIPPTISFFRTPIYLTQVINIFLSSTNTSLRIDVAEILELIAMRIPYVLLNILPQYLPKFLKQFEIPNENLVHKSISRIIKYIIHFETGSAPFDCDNFVLILESIVDMPQGEVYTNIIESLRKLSTMIEFDRYTIEKLIDILNSTKNKNLISYIFKFMRYQLKRDRSDIFEYSIPFNRILTENKLTIKNSKIQKSVLKFILAFTSFPSYLVNLYLQNIVDIQNSLIFILCKYPFHPMLAFNSLINTLQFRKLDITSEFIGALYNYASYIQYCGFVAYICHWNYSNPDIYYSYVGGKAIKTSKTAEMPVGSLKIPTETENLFTNPPELQIPNNLHDIFDAMKSYSINKSGIMYCGFIPKIIEYISSEEVVDFQEFGIFISNLLEFCCFDNLYVWDLSSEQFIRFISSEKAGLVESQNGIFEFPFRPYECCLSIIGKLNNSLNPLNDQRKQAILDSPFWKHLRYDQIVDIQHGVALYLDSICQNSSLPCLKAGDKYFGVFSSMLDVLVSQAESILEVENTKITAKLEESYYIVTNDHVVQEIDSNLRSLLDLLKLINEKSKFGVNDEIFVEKIEDQLRNPCHSISHYCSALSIVYNYSFLFPFKIRLLVLHLLLFQPYDAIVSYNNYFQIPDGQNAYVQDSLIKLSLPRTDLFPIVLNDLLPIIACPLPIDVNFIGETGSGRGPTKDFFQIIFKEIILNTKLFWKTSTGYFPSPFCDPSSFYAIGALSAKMIMLNCICGITISPAFFNLVYGQIAAIEDVDADLSSNLKKENYFLGDSVPYMFPGVDGVLNSNHTNITEENYQEYIEDVKKAVFSPNVMNAAERFKEGFKKVLPHVDVQKLFSADEISQIICGDEAQRITSEQMNSFSIVDLGYNKESRQFQWLCDYVDQLQEETRKFIKFVTGNDLLPIGGLKYLTPPLKVIKMEEEKPDLFFPSSSTCSNMLKLPEYSSRDILFTKLTEAINSGNERFDLV